MGGICMTLHSVKEYGRLAEISPTENGSATQRPYPEALRKGLERRGGVEKVEDGRETAQ